MITHYIFTALGGAFGAASRLWIGKLCPTQIYGVPTTILIVNILGCFMMGLLVEIMSIHWTPTDQIRYFLIPGFLGGFTTFSAFSLEFGLLLEKNEVILAFSYVTLSVALSLLFFIFGIKLARLF